MVTQLGLGCRTVLAAIHIGAEMWIGGAWVLFIVIGKEVDEGIIGGS